MNNVKEILCFLIELGFTDRKNNDHFGTLRCLKQRLFVEFEDCDVLKLIDALNFIDEMNVLFMTINLDFQLEKTNSLRECIL